MHDVASIYRHLEATIEANLRSKVWADVRAEVLAEISRERAALGVRLITKRTVWEKLGISEDTLDELRREDPTFPKPKAVRGRLQWREHDVDEWIERP